MSSVRPPTARWLTIGSGASIVLSIAALILKILETYIVRKNSYQTYLLEYGQPGLNLVFSGVFYAFILTIIYHAATFYVAWKNVAGASFIPREFSRSGLAGAYIMALVWLGAVIVETLFVVMSSWDPNPISYVGLVLVVAEDAVFWYIAARSTVERKKLLREHTLGDGVALRDVKHGGV